MAGRHRKPNTSTSAVTAAKIAVTGAILGGSSLALTNQASAAIDNEWDPAAHCESGGNWHINTGNGFYGGLQFDYGTWLGAGGGVYAQRADLATRAQQIAIGSRVYAARGSAPWPACGHHLYD